MVGNQFLNFFLLGVSELPANLVGYWLVEAMGRRWSQVLAFFLAAVFILLAIQLQGLDRF